MMQNTTVIAIFSLAGPAAGDVIYSNFQNIGIPATFTGLYLDIDQGNGWDTSPVTGWDINPFFGGIAVANSADFQPARVSSTSSLSTIQSFGVGTTIDASLIFSAANGSGGSQDHLGLSGSGTPFIAGQEGYLGYRLNDTGYGWMRVVFDGTGTTAAIKDWAYDPAGPIIVGRVNQSAPLSGTQLMTLSPATAESFALGSPITDTGGNVNSLFKTGAGTTTLTGTNTYTGTTTVDAGILALGSTGSIHNTSSITVNATTTLDVSAVEAFTVGSSQILQGSGTVIGNTTVSGTLAPGNSAGNLTFNSDLTLPGLFEWTLAALATSNPGINFDTVTLTDGDANIIGASLGLNLGANAPSEVPFWQTQQEWSGILNNSGTGTLTGYFDIVTNQSVWSSLGTFSTTYSDNDVNLVWTPVPEPSSAIATLLGMGIALLRRRRSP